MKLAIIRQRYNPYGGAERFVDSLVGRIQSVIGFVFDGLGGLFLRRPALPP